MLPKLFWFCSTLLQNYECHSPSTKNTEISADVSKFTMLLFTLDQYIVFKTINVAQGARLNIRRIRVVKLYYLS